MAKKDSEALHDSTAAMWEKFQIVINASLRPYVEAAEDKADAAIAEMRLAELAEVPKRLVKGAALKRRLTNIEG